MARRDSTVDRLRHKRPRLAAWCIGASAMLLGLALCASAEAASPCAATGREAYAPWVFFGFACDGHCRDHKAGFAWAELNGIGNAAGCAGRDARFAEGCRVYAEAVVTAEQAGFEWARENEVTAACDCGGAGDAFRAGCEAYLQAISD
jgi:hypothetical protein